MTRRARLMAAALTLTVPLGLGACGREEVSISSPSRSGTQGSTLTLDGPGQVLTEEQVTTALVEQDSMPSPAWVLDTSEDGSQGGVPDLDSERCEAWFAAWAASSKKPKRSAQRTFNKRGNYDQASLTYMVQSFDDPADAGERQRVLAQAPTACAAFTEHAAKGQGQTYDMRWEMKASTFARPGDASQAIEARLTYDDPETHVPQVRYTQLAIVQVGHNELFLQSYDEERIGDSALNKMLTDGFARLEDVSR